MKQIFLPEASAAALTLRRRCRLEANWVQMTRPLCCAAVKVTQVGKEINQVESEMSADDAAISMKVTQVGREG